MTCSICLAISRQAKAGSLRRIFSPGAQLGDLSNVAVCAKSAQVRFQTVQKIERGLRSLRGIRPFLIGDAHLKVRRHGAVIELMDLRHRSSFRRGRPQQDEHAGALSEEIRAENSEIGRHIVRRPRVEVI